MAKNEIEKFFGDIGYAYCDASEVNFKALEDKGHKYHRGHSKLHVGEKNYFIEISKECDLRVVLSHCEEVDFKASKIFFNQEKQTWEECRTK